MTPLQKSILPPLRWLRQKLIPEGLENPDAPSGWPPGHFYSPIPSLKEVRHRAARIFERHPAQLPGIDLDTTGQLERLRTLAQLFESFPFSQEPQTGRRFHWGNPNFALGEALVLSSWLRHYRPRRVVEIGSGYSSCCILDTVDLFLNGAVECAFLDPYPELLQKLLSPEDKARVEILTCPVQDLEVSWFGRLQAGDLLFIDSSHVAKVGSDVNYLIFDVLPSLAKGVFIHIHDIYYPFEYPEDWVYQGRAWNEAYVLRAFLQFNESFRIRLWANYLVGLKETVTIAGPLLMQHSGSSLWLEKTK